MAKNKQLIMAWSKCRVDFAPMPDDESMADASTMFNVGIIRTNTTQLSTEDGDALQAIETGGAVVAEEKTEGTFELTTEVIEPTDDLYVNLGIGRMDSNGDDVLVDTHVVPGYYSMTLTPKNLGAKGIKAPKCSISVSPAFGDDTGNALTITATILQGEAGYWYSKFLNRGDLQVSKTESSLTNADTSSSPTETISVTTEESVITAKSNAAWCIVKVEDKSVKIGATSNSGGARTASVTITAGSAKALITVVQAGGE